MAFQVDITETALTDAEEYVRFIRRNGSDPNAADRWFRGLGEAINSLGELPERCPMIPEQEDFSLELRHLIYYSHRIIFRVQQDANRVIVYRVYHGSRREIDVGDVPIGG